jgi:hypothetical protein
MNRQQKIEGIANQHGGVSKVSNLQHSALRVNPDYFFEPCDGVRSETGKLEIFKLVSKARAGPYFVGRWDQKKECLDIDMRCASKNAIKAFKKGAGHHPNRSSDPNTRTFEFKIDTPRVGFVFEGSVSFANTFQVMAKFEATSKITVDIQVHKGGTALKGDGRFSA